MKAALAFLAIVWCSDEKIAELINCRNPETRRPEMTYRIPAEYLPPDANATYVENGPNYDVTIEEAHLDVQITPRRKYKGYENI